MGREFYVGFDGLEGNIIFETNDQIYFLKIWIYVNYTFSKSRNQKSALPKIIAVFLPENGTKLLLD